MKSASDRTMYSTSGSRCENISCMLLTIFCLAELESDALGGKLVAMAPSDPAGSR